MKSLLPVMNDVSIDFAKFVGTYSPDTDVDAKNVSNKVDSGNLN